MMVQRCKSGRGAARDLSLKKRKIRETQGREWQVLRTGRRQKRETSRSRCPRREKNKMNLHQKKRVVGRAGQKRKRSSLAPGIVMGEDQQRYENDI